VHVIVLKTVQVAGTLVKALVSRPIPQSMV